MNKQRQVLITTTYNEMGIIIDIKAEKIEHPKLQQTCDQLATDTISRQALCEYALNQKDKSVTPNDIMRFPSAQPKPSDITDEQAILHLQSTGWMQNHDREMYESGLKKRLADDSGDYDSLIPCEDPISRQQAITALRALSDEDGYINVPHEVVTDVVRGLPPVKVKQGQTVHSERGKTDKFGVKTGETYKDTISRQAAIDACHNWDDGKDAYAYGYIVEDRLKALPSAQPKRTEERTETHECDCISRQAAIDAIKNTYNLSYIEDGFNRQDAISILEQLPSAQSEWNNHTVACLLAELFDDPCACNYNGIDEWLPKKCEVIDSCPNPVGVACWEQYLKHRAERRTDE